MKYVLLLAVLCAFPVLAEAQEGFLISPSKKAVLLSESADKPESDNLDSLMMRVQDLEQQVRALTGELETANRTLDEASKRLEGINSDNNLRFKDLEEKIVKLDQDFKTLQQTMSDRMKAEVAEKEAERKRKQQEAARAKSEKEKAEKAKAEYAKMTPKQLYDSAIAALKKPDYKDAEKQFEAFMLLYPKDELAGNAQYWLGESYYARGNYADAAVAFADGFKNYRQSQKAPDNLLKLGLTLANLKKKDEACIAFKNFAKEYPKVSDAMKKRLETEAKKLACP